MWKRQTNPSRRIGESSGSVFQTQTNSKNRPSGSILSIGIVVFIGALILFAYSFTDKGGIGNAKRIAIRNGGDSGLCSREVQRAIPVLKKAYGEKMLKVLHVGPEACSVVSKLLGEQETEAWGIEPYDLDDSDAQCRALVRNGIVRVSDIKFPLPYRSKSFSLVIVSDALDYLSPRYLNKTLPELARVSSEGLVIFSGYPDNQKATVSEVSKFGRAAKLRSFSWWVKYLGDNNLEQNEGGAKKFEEASTKMSYASRCQVFHIMPFH